MLLILIDTTTCMVASFLIHLLIRRNTEAALHVCHQVAKAGLRVFDFDVEQRDGFIQVDD